MYWLDGVEGWKTPHNGHAEANLLVVRQGSWTWGRRQGTE